MKVHDTQQKDRRVQKTRRLLLEAFGSLLIEKRYDAIVVREILDRANVGRSAFYAHFRDKDALLVCAIRDLLRTAVPDSPLPARRSERVLRFSRPIVEHIAQHVRAGKGRMGIRSRTIVHERLRQVLAEHVAEEARLGSGRSTSCRVPGELLVQHVTSSFVTVLNWWVENGSKLSPAEVDEIFRALVLPSLAAALD
jgi:AcrR family transcriptional regulator